MTPDQIKLARHALGLPNKQRKAYRNRFVAHADSPDGHLWSEMVHAGFAVCTPDDIRPDGWKVFRLTIAGAFTALEDSETIPVSSLASKHDGDTT